MSTGLLILCSPLNQLMSRVNSLAKVASKTVRKTLYVQLELNSCLFPNPTLKTSPEQLHNCQRLISTFYLKCHTLDVRFLLATVKNPSLGQLQLSQPVDVILTDCSQSVKQLQQYLDWRFSGHLSKLPVINIQSSSSVIQDAHNNNKYPSTWKTYDNVVLGGTFDRLHNGHRLLLTEAVLHCRKCLTVGVTDGPMIKGKVLWELIEPISDRIKTLSEFLNDVDASVKYRLEPIVDPFGPSTVDPELECIVVSPETKRGGEKVNEERLKKGLGALDIHVIDLLEDEGHSAEEEHKISSSSLRMRSLGRRRTTTKTPSSSLRPYLIGLTGGIASGKSSIANRLKNLGAEVINCDLLGHQSYIKGSSAYNSIVDQFGAEILDQNSDIDRKSLGKIVFSDPKHLQKLNSIVWPEIGRLAQLEIERLGRNGASVIVLEAAVLLEAGWDDLVHEIWVSIIPEQEAVKRIVNRDKLDEEQAKLRLARQISNWERVQKANVVFSTAWEPQYTQKQVENAWSELNNILATFPPTKL